MLPHYVLRFAGFAFYITEDAIHQVPWHLQSPHHQVGCMRWRRGTQDQLDLLGLP
jgi:hypothetical protein